MRKIPISTIPKKELKNFREKKFNLVMMKIGIVGRGFVGSAVEFGFSPNVGCDADVKIYDKDKSKSTHPLSEVLTSDFIFVSVPTPSNLDGSMNIDILESALQDIQVVNKRKDNIILIRSTVIPGTTTKLARKFNAPVSFSTWFALFLFLSKKPEQKGFFKAIRFSRCRFPRWPTPTTPIFFMIYIASLLSL